MKVVVAARCYNNARFVERFLRGYDFADRIVISDGGSTDGSVEMLEKSSKVELIHFDQYEEKDGRRWNPDAPHMNFVLDYAKGLEPDWLVFDDFDCVPNKSLRDGARNLFAGLDAIQNIRVVQVNVFRLYLWNEDEYFPYMNRNFHPEYKSLWAWKPNEINIYADQRVRHGTMVGMATGKHQICDAELPYCLLHKSWDKETVQEKIDKYKAFDIAFEHPLAFAGKPEPLPEWAVE